MGVPQMSLTLRVLARLLTYPDAELRRHLPAMSEALAGERPDDAIVFLRRAPRR